LGVDGKHLRTDILHDWQDSGKLENLKLALDQLAEGQSITLYQDVGYGFPKYRFIQAGNALIRICVTAVPGTNDNLDVVDVVKTEHVLTVQNRPLELVAHNGVQAVLEDLYAALQASPEDTNAHFYQQFETLMLHLQEQAPHHLCNPEGWQRLKDILAQHLNRGTTPEEIARLLEGRRDSHSSRRFS
jgi:hypothetical protein